MKQKHTFFVTTGIPSLFLIFSVLCLCVLALLTLGSSRTSLNAARHSLEQTEKYYNACSKASETTAEIRSELTRCAADASDETGYFSMVKKLADEKKSLTWDPDAHTLSFFTEITDTQQLSVVLEIFFPGKEGGPLLNIRQWNTTLTGTWTPDNHQNVFKGE